MTATLATVAWRDRCSQAIVKGRASSDNIKNACSQLGYRTPCAHSTYASQGCVPLIPNLYVSYPPHTDFPKNVGDRIVSDIRSDASVRLTRTCCVQVWFAGNNPNSLMTIHGTHQWTGIGDIDRTTLCVE